MLAGFHLPTWRYPEIAICQLLLLIYSESINFYPGSAYFKCMASLAFLAAGARNASLKGVDLASYGSLLQQEHRPAVLLVLGLLFSVFGDILLIPSSKIYHQKTPSKDEGDSLSFKAGTFFFALAHIAYIAAFISGDGPQGVRWATFFVTLKFGGVFTYWLGVLAKNPTPNAWFAVPQDMRGLVTAYVLIIWMMVATATATDSGYEKVAGGWIFMISDLFVASDVFGRKGSSRTDTKGRGRPGWKARSVGWIAYYGAQLILAGSI